MGAENAATPKVQQTHDLSENEEPSRVDEVICADDVNATRDIDAAPQLTQKLLNYGALTSKRDVKIHWVKVGIIARLKEHGALKEQLPNPVNLASIETSGQELGDTYI